MRVSRSLPFLAAALLAAAPLHAQTRIRQRPTGSLDSLSDEFAGAASLARWTRFDTAGGWPDVFRRLEVDTAAGTLVVEPWTSGWYADFHGAYLSQRVEGDFDVTVRLQATGLATPVPTRNWSLAGLMVREPRPVTPATWTPGGENWLFLTTGTGDRPEPMFETKSTVNSRSNLKLRPAKAGWVELRIVRLRDAFVLLRRLEGQTAWTVQERFLRRDLPPTLEVGLAAYTDWDSAERFWRDPRAFNTTRITDGRPDLRVTVDWIRFRRPALAEGFWPETLTDYSVSNDDVARALGG